MPSCPLCAAASRFLDEDELRLYFRCGQCALIFVDPAAHLDPAAERARYDLHENDWADPRYRRFLDRLARPLLTRLEPGMCGLDYGCGPGPALSRMMQEAGMVMDVYDPYYEPRVDVLARQYDFVTCTEVAEHFHHPARDWARLTTLVKPGGWLGVMTQLAPPDELFLQWRYRRDPTHVCFYGPATFEWLALRFGFTMERERSDVVVLQKLPQTS